MAQWSEEIAGKRIRQADGDKSASDEIYREAVELTFPDRENWTRTKEGQDKSSGFSWDSQPQVSIIRSANRLSADFTPQFTPWLEIGLGAAAKAMPDAAFEGATGLTKEKAKEQLENITAVVQAVFHGPGFATASNELYIDWQYGQGGMSIMPAPDSVKFESGPVVFAAMPLSHFYAYEGPNGILDRWFFWHTLRADVIKHEWPDATLTAELKEMAKPESKKNEAKLVSVCYRDYEDKVFRYEVFHKHGHQASRIVSREYRTSPFQTPRHSKLAGENRGRGPVIFALPDIRTTNKIVELTLRAAAVAVAGIYTAVDTGVLSPVRIKPLSVIKVRSNGGPNGPSLQRLDTSNQRLDFGELLLENLHENIKKVLGDNSLPPEAGPIRTATEFIQRARELIQDQAGGLGRLYSEFIVPSTQRIVDVLEGQQLLPTSGLRIDGFLTEVRMQSPLAKGEAMQEVENIVRFIELLKTLGGPEMAMLEVDIDKASALIGDLMDVPMTIRNDKDKKAGIKKKFAAMTAAQQGGDPAVAEETMEQLEEDAA